MFVLNVMELEGVKMEYAHDKAGNLVMVPDCNDSREIGELCDKQAIRVENEWLIEQGFDLVEVACCTAPAISYGEEIYGYMDYQVKSFLEELAAGREVVWKKG